MGCSGLYTPFPYNDERMCKMFTVYLCWKPDLGNLSYEDEGWVLLIQQNQHCGDCSLKNWFTNCPSLINELLHCSFSGECPGFRRLFKALDGTPSVRPEPFHCFCHPAQSDRGLGKNGSFSRKSCKIYPFAEFFTLRQKCQLELLIDEQSWSGNSTKVGPFLWQAKEINGVSKRKGLEDNYFRSDQSRQPVNLPRWESQICMLWICQVLHLLLWNLKTKIWFSNLHGDVWLDGGWDSLTFIWTMSLLSVSLLQCNVE